MTILMRYSRATPRHIASEINPLTMKFEVIKVPATKLLLSLKQRLKTSFTR